MRFGFIFFILEKSFSIKIEKDLKKKTKKNKKTKKQKQNKQANKQAKHKIKR